MKIWPPPTNGMTADQLVELRKVAADLIQHIGPALTTQCATEGHVWDNPTGRKETGYHDEWASDAAGDSIKYQVGTDYFIRTCKRCGYKDTKSPVLESPFKP